ncbi:MAG: hypothetical protein JWM91_5284 [Rhodospirillales bacterium]|nr:hypothetical protein [Rhodospirillales bacterium]
MDIAPDSVTLRCFATANMVLCNWRLENVSKAARSSAALFDDVPPLSAFADPCGATERDDRKTKPYSYHLSRSLAFLL